MSDDRGARLAALIEDELRDLQRPLVAKRLAAKQAKATKTKAKAR